MERTWPLPPSSHKEMPWEAQSDATSSRDVPDGWTLWTLLQLSNQFRQHGTLSICYHFVFPISLLSKSVNELWGSRNQVCLPRGGS